MGNKFAAMPMDDLTRSRFLQGTPRATSLQHRIRTTDRYAVYSRLQLRVTHRLALPFPTEIRRKLDAELDPVWRPTRAADALPTPLKHRRYHLRSEAIALGQFNGRHLAAIRGA